MVSIGQDSCPTAAAMSSKAARHLNAVAVASFKELRAAINAAPTNGEQTTIEIEGDLPAWTSDDGMDSENSIIILSSGKNIMIRGVGAARSVLDAQGSGSSQRRHFYIETGAKLEISHIVLQNGYAASPDQSFIHCGLLFVLTRTGCDVFECCA